MASDLIRYDLLVKDALRAVVRSVLQETARDGLRGDHHFLITFKTNVPGVRLSERMRARYPDEMPIILQHQFWDLSVTEQGFEVGLSFGGVPERLSVPFAAMVAFSDPAAGFGLKFEVHLPAEASSDKPSGTVTKLGAGSAPKLATIEAAEDAAKAEKATAPVKLESIERPAKAQKADVEKPKAEAKSASGKKGASKSGVKVPEGEDKPSEDAKIVSIDAFRKK